MYMNRAIVLLLGLALIFMPAIEEWLWHHETAWYRPYLLWLVAVAASWWNQRSRFPDEL